MPYLRPFACTHKTKREPAIKKSTTIKKRTPTPSLLGEVSPQLLGDMRERSEITDTGNAPDSGLDLLRDMKDRLSLEGREMQRMEDEGGLTLKPSQEAKANACLKASQRIKTLLRVSAKKPRTRKTPAAC